MLSRQVSDCQDGSIFASAVAEAYDYALANGAHIVQCSFGMQYPSGFAPTAKAPWFHAGEGLEIIRRRRRKRKQQEDKEKEEEEENNKGKRRRGLSQVLSTHRKARG